MEFNGQYLTYEEYTNLGGTGLTQMPFNLLEFEARRRIDLRTFNRLKDVDSEDIPQEVKLCDYKLIESIQNYTKTLEGIANNGGVASENTDGYSISYMTSNQISDIVKSKSDELDDIIRTYLLNVNFNGEHLMYVGVE
jgi:hypothetical protein